MACKQQSKLLNLSINGTLVNTAVKSFTNSKKYIKTMVRGSLLNILYRRIAMDETEFTHKSYEQIPFVIFKKNSKIPLIREYHGWVNAIIEAIDKNYLKDIHLFMKDSISGDIIEYYTFCLKYNKSDTKQNASNDLKEDTVNFLKVLCDLSDNPKLTETTVVSIEFTYYDDTPENYEPPGFMPSTNRDCLQVPKNNEGNLMVLGKLNTGFHKFSCRATGKIFQTSAAPSVYEIQEDDVKPQDLMDIEEAKIQENNYEFTEDWTVPNIASDLITDNLGDVIQPTSNHNILDSSNITISSEGVDTRNIIYSPNSTMNNLVNCFCTLSLESIAVDVICCNECKIYYHGPCHGYLNKYHVVEPFFVCFNCNRSSDLWFQELDDLGRKHLAQIRLILALIDKSNKFPYHVMDLMSNEGRNNILEELPKNGIFVDSQNKLKINRTIVNQKILQFFKMNNDSQILC